MTDMFSLPSNFYPITSAKLLTAPEPQYLYCQLLMSAFQKDLAIASGVDLAMHWGSIDAAGDSMAYGELPEKDRLMLASPLPDVFAVKTDITGQPGLTLRINRPLFANTTYTEASREVGPGTTISTTPIGVGEEQNSITLKRFAGPYDSTNSRVAPYAIDKLMAKAGVHSLASLAGAHLKRDMHRSFDSFIKALLDLGTAIYPTGMTAANDATATGQFPVDYDLVMRTQESMDNANLPTFSDGFRLLVLTPTQCRQLAQDPAYRFEAHDHKEYSSLFPSYIKTVGKFHVFKSTTLTTTNNSSQIPIHIGHAIAPGCLGGVMGEPPRVAKASDTNYDEQAKLIWIAYLGLKLMDSNFVYAVKTSA